MIHQAKSLRAFIGAKDFKESRSFYRELGFQESIISEKMSLFTVDQLGFYLQDYYVKDWLDNFMMFLEVDSVDRYWQELQQLQLPEKYPLARLEKVREDDWGKVCFLHDPSGALWHFGEFY
ncbi:MAG: glyoxalase [Bacteroidota bacterium]